MEMQSPKSKRPTVLSRATTNGGPRDCLVGLLFFTFVSGSSIYHLLAFFP